MLNVAAIAFFSLACRLPQNPINSLGSQLWEPNGAVLCSALYGEQIYIAGEFSYLGPHTGCGQAISRVGHQLAAGYGSSYEVNDRVLASIPDGQGGWYIGGDFTQIGNETRNHIARLSADGSPYPWNPGADGPVWTLALSGDLLYAGGEFSSIGGQSRSRIAALDTSTGLATAWDPGVTGGMVQYIIVNGDRVYIGGEFRGVGAGTRNGLAAVDASTGQVLAWNPNPMWDAMTPGLIKGMSLEGSTLFVAGLFKTIGGQARRYMAAVSTETGLATAMDADAYLSSDLRSVLAHDGVVYLGGDSLKIDGQQAGSLVALNAETGEVLKSYSNLRVFSELVLFGDTLYVAGGYGGYTPMIACIETNSGLISTLDLQANGSVRAVAVTDGWIYAGGDFTSIGGVRCGRVAALDLDREGPPVWSADITTGYASSIAASETTVYIGGGFTEVSGQLRNRIAALDIATGSVTSWNPNADDEVAALAIGNGVVYAGGRFTNIGGQPRARIAALNLSTGQATAWNPSVEDSYISSLSIGTGVVYAAGVFCSVGGTPRSGIAAISTQTGSATAWNPAPDVPPGIVSCVGNQVYVAQGFTSIGGVSRNGLACLSAQTGLASAWDPNSGGATCFTADGGTLFIGGLASFNGVPRGGMAATSLATGLLADFDPRCIGLFPVLTIGAKADAVYIGGNFRYIDGRSRRFFAAVDRESGHLLN
jgi:hypothetical protein